MSNFQHRNDNNRNNSREDQEDGPNAQLFIAKGRNDGMDHKSLVEFIVAQTNTAEEEISNVKVLDAFSFFAVPNSQAGKILDFFQEKAGEGRPLVSRAKRKNPSGGGYGGFGGGNRNGGNGGGGYRNDRPRRDFGDRDRPERPRRDFGDRPRRDFGNRDNNGNY